MRDTQSITIKLRGVNSHLRLEESLLAGENTVNSSFLKIHSHLRLQE